MHVVKPLQSRAMIATVLLFSFLALEDHGAAKGVAEESDTVTVTAVVTDSTPPPGCEGFEAPITFAPTAIGVSLDLADLDLADSLQDTASIDLGIVEGQDANCDFIDGYVVFSESGFDSDLGAPSGFLTTSFTCDSAPISLVGGFFTCGPTLGGNPSFIDMTVTADPDFATEGTFSNRLNIALYAND